MFRNRRKNRQMRMIQIEKNVFSPYKIMIPANNFEPENLTAEKPENKKKGK